MSKSKLAVISLSLMATFAAVYIYMGHKNPKADNTPSDSAIKAKLTSFELYRYRGDQLVARATGNDATLFSRGRFVSDGRTRLVQIAGGQRQEIESDKAEVMFQSENLFGEGAGLIDTILFSGNVDYIRGNSRFQTDWIKYTEKTKEAMTDRPVRFESNGQFIAAEGGMIYNTATESIKMKGGVFGSVRSDVVTTGGGGSRKK